MTSRLRLAKANSAVEYSTGGGPWGVPPHGASHQSKSDDYSCRHLQPRAAFTLLEVIIAIGLTTLLMAAVYAAMNTYWSLAVESHDEVKRTEIARGVMDEIARDILSVTFSEQDTTTSEDDPDDTGMTASTDNAATYTNGLIGTPNDLVLYISRPDRHLNYVAAPLLTSGSDRSSDQVIVRYLLADPQLGGLAAAVASREQQGRLSSGGSAGLARVYGDLHGLSNAILMGDVETQLGAAKLLAPEVADVTFSYFDGVDWQAEWDSTELNMIPLAIEIMLTLHTLDEDGVVDDGRKSLPPSQHRLVVPIPVATPYVAEAGI